MSAIVLFDGVCNFCDASVNFIIEHDCEGYFRFAPLQSEAGQRFAAEYGLSNKVSNVRGADPDLMPIDSVILLEDGKVYTHSTAALRVTRKLSGLWKLLYVFILVPAFIRDYFYRLFARYRYRFFGKKDACMLPTAEVRARFL